MTKRPQFKARPWIWKDGDDKTPGVGLFENHGLLRAHYTIPEARTLADRLHDLCDAAGNPEPALPTTEAEQE